MGKPLEKIQQNKKHNELKPIGPWSNIYQGNAGGGYTHIGKKNF